MRKLKKCHKNLMICEAGFIYCKRHDLNNDTFIEDIFMKDEFNSESGSEFDKICEDLRCYRYFESYKLKEISEAEYEMCIDQFGEN